MASHVQSVLRNIDLLCTRASRAFESLFSFKPQDYSMIRKAILFCQIRILAEISNCSGFVDLAGAAAFERSLIINSVLI